MTHPPEPWTLVRYGNVHYQHKDTITIDHNADGSVIEEIDTPTAERIVACVNALRDIPTPIINHSVFHAWVYANVVSQAIQTRASMPFHRLLCGFLPSVDALVTSTSTRTLIYPEQTN